MLAAVRHRLPADLLLLVTVLIWSFHFAVIKYGLTHGFTPLAYATVRFGVGSMIFAGLTYGRERSLSVQRRDLWILFGVVALSLYLNQMSFAYSIKLTTASTVALLFGTLPIFVGIIAWLTGVERPSRLQWLAICVSFLGVSLVAADAEGGLSGDLGGILVGLVAPVTWSLYSVLVGPLLRRYSPYRISAVVGMAAIVPLALTSIPELSSEGWDDVGALAWGALAFSILLAFVFANVLWFTAIDRVGPNRASLYANLQPFLGALFAVLALGETMGTLQIAGGAVIAAGILLARGRRAPVEILD
jgi:drug/metabolite transporter (DMT)-like permease